MRARTTSTRSSWEGPRQGSRRSERVEATMGKAYDKAKWHYDGDYPKDLPRENGATHIGMFLAWVIANGLEGELHRDQSTEALERVRQRQMTGRTFLIEQCDEALTNEDLNEVGNAFATAY